MSSNQVAPKGSNAKKTRAPASSRSRTMQDKSTGGHKKQRTSRSDKRDDAQPPKPAPSVSLDWFSVSPAQPQQGGVGLDDTNWYKLDAISANNKGGEHVSPPNTPHAVSRPIVHDGLSAQSPRVSLLTNTLTSTRGTSSMFAGKKSAGIGFRAVLPPSITLIVEEANRTLSNAIQMTKTVLARPTVNVKSTDFGMCVFKSIDGWVVGHLARRRRYFQSVCTNLTELHRRIKSDLERICLTPLSTPARLRHVISHVETTRKRLDISIDEVLHESFQSVYGAGKNVQLIFGPSGCGKNLAVRLLETVHLKPIVTQNGERGDACADHGIHEFLHTWHFDQLASLSLDSVLDSIESFFSSLWLVYSNSLQRIGTPRCGLMSNIDSLFDGAIFDEDAAQPAIFQCLWRCIEQYAVKYPPQVRPILYITSSSGARCFLVRELARKISSLNTDGLKMSVNYDFCECFYEKTASEWLVAVTKPGALLPHCLGSGQFPNITHCAGKPSTDVVLKGACRKFASVVGQPQLKHMTMAKWLFAIDWMLVAPSLSSYDSVPPNSSSTPSGGEAQGTTSNLLQYSFFQSVQLCLQPSIRSKVCDTSFFWDMMHAYHDNLHNLPRLLFDFATQDATIDATLLSDVSPTALCQMTPDERMAIKKGSAFNFSHPFLTNTYDVQCLGDGFAKYDYSRDLSCKFVSSALEVLARCSAAVNPFDTPSAGNMSVRVYKALSGFQFAVHQSDDAPQGPPLRFALPNAGFRSCLLEREGNCSADSTHNDRVFEALNQIVR